MFGECFNDEPVRAVEDVLVEFELLEVLVFEHSF